MLQFELRYHLAREAANAICRNSVFRGFLNLGGLYAVRDEFAFMDRHVV